LVEQIHERPMQARGPDGLAREVQGETIRPRA
jgi:hypothetical protein